jgi:hypothetical protein
LDDYAVLSSEWMVQVHRTPSDALRDSHGS